MWRALLAGRPRPPHARPPSADAPRRLKRPAGSRGLGRPQPAALSSPAHPLTPLPPRRPRWATPPRAKRPRQTGAAEGAAARPAPPSARRSWSDGVRASCRRGLIEASFWPERLRASIAPPAFGCVRPNYCRLLA